jgi:hypothetical protein
VGEIYHAFKALAAAWAQDGNNRWKEGCTPEEIIHIDHVCQASAQPGNVFDFAEIDKVIDGTATGSDVKDVHVHRVAGQGSTWDVVLLMRRNGM